MHYVPSDPAVCTPDPAADRHDNAVAVRMIVLMFVAGATAVVSGLVLL